MQSNKPSNQFNNQDLVKVKQVKNYAEISMAKFQNHICHAKRLSKGRHINLATGEVIEDNPLYNRANSNYLEVCNRNLAELIKHNFIDCDKVLLLTLSYNQKHSDHKKVTEDFKRFIKNLRNKIIEFGKIDYISKLELYADLVNFHIHAILFFNNTSDKVFIEREVIDKIWGKGFVYIEKPKNENQVVAYLTPHKVKVITEENRHMHEKALRNDFLPAGMKFYRYSSGIKKPIIYIDIYENAVQDLKDKGFNYNSTNFLASPVNNSGDRKFYYIKERYTK
ncbi:MAG: hypothetical protein IJX26_03690 [Clostridia bacterium]|nr:hypothetical protein [Clostridia bacterium]